MDCRCFFVLAALMLCISFDTSACTTAVISGRATVDGRPLLWKNRDYSSRPQNEVALFTHGRYREVAVVNAGSRSSIWMGANEAGLCIENSLSKDLGDGSFGGGLGNGQLMKRALLNCATVDEVRKLLDETNKTGRKTKANIGVIDAQGGAALFEVGSSSYKMFDANDPTVAPAGYIVRANFATTAHGLSPCPAADGLDDIYSAERYSRACELLAGAMRGRLSVAFLVQKVARDLVDDNGEAIVGSVNGDKGELPRFVSTSHTVSRWSTVSATVFHGVARGEDPRLTTMWVMLGDPKFSVAVPCFPTMNEVADSLEGENGGEIGEIARTLRDASLTKTTGTIRCKNLPGIWEDTLPLESKHLKVALEDRGFWLEHGVDDEQLKNQHQVMAKASFAAMRKELSEAKALALATKRGSYVSQSKAGEVKVAIYDHSDGSANGPKNLLRLLSADSGFSAGRVTPQQIRGGCLANYDVLIMPGGSGSSQSQHLEEKGRGEIRDFVSAGGGYVGICAGAYLASNHYNWSLGIINARVWDRVHWARGTGTVTMRLTPPGRVVLCNDGKQLDVYYGQGPLLVPGLSTVLPPYELLASYETEIAEKGAIVGSMTGTHAIVRSTFGKGRVICFSPHPETKTGPNHLMTAGIRWAARSGKSTTNSPRAHRR